MLPLGLFVALAACGGGSRPADLALAPGTSGPAADFPVVIGQPYIVDGVTYTPADVWNYDEVGYLALDTEGGGGVSGAHRTLPLPSYVEVTSLETGRTILVRLQRRGPMQGSSLLALSPGAASHLGASSGTPIRVRRVNPPEHERALLRAGEQAPERMETPASLVEVLKRKLPPGSGGPVDGTRAPVAAAMASQETAPGNTDSPLALPTLSEAAAPSAPAPAPTPAPTPVQDTARTTPAPAATAQPPAPSGRSFVVQAGAFSSKERADRVASAIGGTVTRAGTLYRVRTGPFPTRQAAEASLAKVKAAGYSEARIF